MAPWAPPSGGIIPVRTIPWTPRASPRALILEASVNLPATPALRRPSCTTSGALTLRSLVFPMALPRAMARVRFNPSLVRGCIQVGDDRHGPAHVAHGAPLALGDKAS